MSNTFRVNEIQGPIQIRGSVRIERSRVPEPVRMRAAAFGVCRASLSLPLIACLPRRPLSSTPRGLAPRPPLAAMDDVLDHYPLPDPYSRRRLDQGIDSKIVVMGSSGASRDRRSCLSLLTAPATGVGKTSLLQRYTQNRFDPRNTTSTSGAFFVTKKVTVHGVRVRLQLWDTAGQERFRSMVRTLHFQRTNIHL